MSLSRLALRLAAYEALAPYASVASSGPWPTLAAGEVYDSRVDPIAAADDWNAFLTKIEGKPLIILYTEEQETSPVEGEYPADKEIAELVAELMIAAAGSVEIETPDGPTTVGTLNATISDRQHEALLDMLEAQVRYLLDPEGNTPSAAIYRTVARELHHVHSVPQREDDKVVRLAARTVKFRLRIPATAWPLQPSSPPASGLGLLPQPLQGVAKAFNPASSGGLLCSSLAGMVAQPAPLTPLTDIRILANVDRATPPTDPAGSDSDVVGDVEMWGATARPSEANVGNGVLTLANPAILAGAQLGSYSVLFSSATAFAVKDPAGNPVADGVVGTAFATQIAFAIAAGSTAFIAGDDFSIAVAPIS